MSSPACGCCSGGSHREPVYNRPGLPALRYRAGTYGTFLSEMVARIPHHRVPEGPATGSRPLASLTTRSTDDPVVALFDAWAVVGDVLTFYQERIANEGFLRTATERRSVLELARAIGYELNPGVAARTYLAFAVEGGPRPPQGGGSQAPELDTTHRSPEAATIPAGVRVQSVPGQDERPQTFETVGSIHGLPEWNAIRPRQTVPQVMTKQTDRLYLRGLDARLQPGDPLLIVGDERLTFTGSERWEVRFVHEVEADSERQRTVVRLDRPLGSVHTWPPQASVAAHVFRQQTGLFGANAPEWRLMPDTVKQAYDPAGWATRTQWPGYEIEDPHERLIHLDGAFPRILEDSWVALSRPGWVELYRVQEISTGSRAGFGLTGKVTRLRLDTHEHLTFFGLRRTVAFVQSEPLVLDRAPDTSPVEGRDLQLEEAIPELAPGRTVIVAGLPADTSGAPSGTARVAEAATVEAVLDGGKLVRLTKPLAGRFERGGALVHGNVAPATHGEAVHEVLGGGDASRPHQRFTLSRPPLTYVPATNAQGAASSLEVRVNGVRWEETRSLLARGPGDEAYTVRPGDDGRATILFGDGVNGARVPTGQTNVEASYRTGTGLEGEVDAGSLTLLQTRPLGVKAVTNPIAASGAGDPEVLDDARDNAPRTVLTLDRVVSLRDFEDFARSFAGVGKAQAEALWRGERRVVHLTIAAASGGEVPPDAPLVASLLAALADAKDPVQEVAVHGFTMRRFHLQADLLVDPRLETDAVFAAAEAALREAFSFHARAFGRPVTSAEVVAMLHRVPGVVAVDLNALHADPPPGSLGAVATLSDVLPAARARRVGDQVLPAELLLLDEGPLVLGTMPG